MLSLTSMFLSFSFCLSLPSSLSKINEKYPWMRIKTNKQNSQVHHQVSADNGRSILLNKVVVRIKLNNGDKIAHVCLWQGEGDCWNIRVFGIIQ